MLMLEVENVSDGKPIVAIALRFPGDVDHDRRTDKLFQRHGFQCKFALREMDRCVDMRAAVLGRAEGVRAIEITGRCVTVGEAPELEISAFGWPINRFFVKRLGEIDQAIGAGVEGMRLLHKCVQ